MSTPPQNFSLCASRYRAFWRSVSPRRASAWFCLSSALELIQRPKPRVTRPPPRNDQPAMSVYQGSTVGSRAVDRAGGRHQRAGLLRPQHARHLLAGRQEAAEGVGPLGLQAHQPLPVQVARAQVQAGVQPVRAAQLAHGRQHDGVGVEALGQPAGVALLQLAALVRRREAQAAQPLGHEAALELRVQHLLAGGLVGRDHDALGQRGHVLTGGRARGGGQRAGAADVGPVGLAPAAPAARPAPCPPRSGRRTPRSPRAGTPASAWPPAPAGPRTAWWPPGPACRPRPACGPGNSSMVSWATFFAWSASLPWRAVTSSRLVRHSRLSASAERGPFLPATRSSPRTLVSVSTASAAAGRRLASHALDLGGQAGDIRLGHRRRLVLGQRGDRLALLHRPLRVLGQAVGQRGHQRRVGILPAAHRDRQHHQARGRVGRPGQGDQGETENRDPGQATVGGHRQQEYSFTGREKG